MSTVPQLPTAKSIYLYIRAFITLLSGALTTIFIASIASTRVYGYSDDSEKHLRIIQIWPVISTTFATSVNAYEVYNYAFRKKSGLRSHLVYGILITSDVLAISMLLAASIVFILIATSSQQPAMVIITTVSMFIAFVGQLVLMSFVCHEEALRRKQGIENQVNDMVSRIVSKLREEEAEVESGTVPNPQEAATAKRKNQPISELDRSSPTVELGGQHKIEMNTNSEIYELETGVKSGTV